MHRGRIQAEIDAADADRGARAAARRWGWPVDRRAPVRDGHRPRGAVRRAVDPDAALPDASRTCSTSPSRPASTPIVAVGMTFVILSGGIDLSVGSIVALVGRRAGHGAAGRPADAGRAAAGARGRARLRPGQRRADQLGRPAAVHRHARHDEHRARRGAALHGRAAGLRVRRVVPRARDRPRRFHPGARSSRWRWSTWSRTSC